MLMLIMDAITALALSESTAGRSRRMEPRKVEAGEYSDTFALPADVRTDPAFAEFLTILDDLEVAEIDPQVAWPSAVTRGV